MKNNIVNLPGFMLPILAFFSVYGWPLALIFNLLAEVLP